MRACVVLQELQLQLPWPHLSQAPPDIRRHACPDSTSTPRLPGGPPSCTPPHVEKGFTQGCSEQFNVLAAIPTTTTSTGTTAAPLRLHAHAVLHERVTLQTKKQAAATGCCCCRRSCAAKLHTRRVDSDERTCVCVRVGER